jgi:hypothetical protein
MKKYLWLALGLAVIATPIGIAVSADKTAAPAAAADKNSTPAAAAAAAPATPKIAGSKISHVTVYPNSALVTREVDVPAGTGTIELIVNPLPPQTLDNTLYSEGSDGLQVLSTRYRQRPIREDTREEVRKLEDELRKLHQNAQKIQADILAATQNMQMIAKLEDFTAAGAKTGDKSALNSESAIALAKYVMESRAAKAKEVVVMQQQLQDNKEQSEYVQRQLRDLTAGTSKVERDAVIVIEKVNAAAGKVKLNYLVSAASWKPQYKFRAGKDEKENVRLEYLAAVIQQTGEDWSGVAMTLSTAQPMLNAAPPDLRVLEVAVIPRGAPNDPMIASGKGGQGQSMQLEQQAKSQRGMVQENYLKKDVGNAVKLLNEAAALDATRELLWTSRDDLVLQNFKNPNKRSGSDEGPSVTCHLPTRLSVPSRHDEQIIEVAKIELAPDYFYKAVPVLTNHVYRQANLTNKSKYVLLPGEATMYQGTDFVGRMNLPLVAIGEQFTAGFGVDPQMQVVRQMIDKTRTTQGGNQVLKFEYRITVNSYKPEAVKLELWDRLPHAEVESVGIVLNKIAPELSKDSLYIRENRPNNLLRWDLEIKPDMNGEKAFAVNYDFQMALDKQMSIGGLQTR